MGNEKAISGELPTVSMELHNPKGYPKCFVSPELQASDSMRSSEGSISATKPPNILQELVEERKQHTKPDWVK